MKVMPLPTVTTLQSKEARTLDQKSLHKPLAQLSFKKSLGHTCGFFNLKELSFNTRLCK